MWGAEEPESMVDKLGDKNKVVRTGKLNSQTRQKGKRAGASGSGKRSVTSVCEIAEKRRGGSRPRGLSAGQSQVET